MQDLFEFGDGSGLKFPNGNENQDLGGPGIPSGTFDAGADRAKDP